MRKSVSTILVVCSALVSFNVFAAENIISINPKSSMQQIMQNPQGLNPKVLKLGLQAYQWAQAHNKVTKPYLTIVDFSVPSKYKRLWVINLRNNKIIEHTLVANGRASGLFVATRFSNRPHSDASSLGVYLTGKQFYGDVGLSMRLHGLQPGINSNVYRRDVVVHSDWYVSNKFAKKYGRVGRSLGCFTLSRKQVAKVVNTIKNGSVLYAYAVKQPGAVAFK